MNTLLERDQVTIWHPFTQHQIAPLPIPITHGKGAYLFDSEGKPYLDLISSWCVNIHGHAHPAIAKAIYEQALKLEQVIFSGFTHEPAVRVAEKLLSLLPAGFTKIFYSDNGSTAVEIALKMAYQYWRNQGEKRHRFLAFSGGYHGDTFGAMAVGKSSEFYQAFSDLLFDVDFAPYPATWEGDEQVAEKEKAALQWLETYLGRYGQETVAVIIEPLIQVTSMQVCRPEFLQALQKLAHQYEVLVIYDEVMTGLGRTGATFACEKAKTKPDLICMAKALTGGFLPLAVTACHEKIYQAFLGEEMNQALIHGHSYSGSPLGCAAALVSLELLNSDNTRQQIQMIEAVHQQMLPQLSAMKGIEKIRYCGTMAAFDLAVKASYGSRMSQNWRERFQERGLIIRPLGQSIYLLPPYCIEEADLRRAYQDILEIIETSIIPVAVRQLAEEQSYESRERLAL